MSAALVNPNVWYVGKLSCRINAAKKRLRSERRKYSGLRVIDLDGEADVFKKGNRFVSIVIASLDKQPPGAFEVFINLNNEVVVKQIRPLPFFYLV